MVVVFVDIVDFVAVFVQYVAVDCVKIMRICVCGGILDTTAAVGKLLIKMQQQ